MGPANQGIHILGLGNLGKLVAHSLAASRAVPSVTLLLHRPQLNAQWIEAGRSIDVVTKGVSNRQKDFVMEQSIDPKSWKMRSIDNLIVASKTNNTVEALRPIRDRLH